MDYLPLSPSIQSSSQHIDTALNCIAIIHKQKTKGCFEVRAQGFNQVIFQKVNRQTAY